MQETQTPIHTPDLHPELDEGPPKPYDQLPGEPNLWYDRFHRFCQMGSSRSLRGCYRQLVAERAIAEGSQPHIPEQAPGAWKRKASQFDWSARADAWDADRRDRSIQRLESTFDRMCDAADQALQYLIDLMSERLEDPNVSVSLIHERRMASQTILDRIDLAPDIVEFVVNSPLVARAARAGQFVRVLAWEKGELVPMTLADWDAGRGTIVMVIQGLGSSSKMMNRMPAEA